MTNLGQHSSPEVMPLPDLIQWEDWHSQVVTRKEALLSMQGEASDCSYDDLRKAEIEAMRQIRAERKGAH